MKKNTGYLTSRGERFSYSAFSFGSILSYYLIASFLQLYLTGSRTPGVAFSLKAFTNKIIIALSSSLAMFGLAAYGFVSGDGVVQTQRTIDGIWFLYSFGPIIGLVISVVLLLLCYKLRDSDVRLMTRYNNNEITREEAQAGFTRKF
jgi:Na+/melibiose symporter-like transporter